MDSSKKTSEKQDGYTTVDRSKSSSKKGKPNNNNNSTTTTTKKPEAGKKFVGHNTDDLKGFVITEDGASAQQFNDLIDRLKTLGGSK